MLEFRRNVASTQAKGCFGCLHVGEVAVYIWPGFPVAYGWRLELLTPLHRFRWHGIHLRERPITRGKRCPVCRSTNVVLSDCHDCGFEGN